MGIQLVETGDAFSGAPPASLDDFEDLTDGSEAEDFGNGQPPETEPADPGYRANPEKYPLAGLI